MQKGYSIQQHLEALKQWCKNLRHKKQISVRTTETEQKRIINDTIFEDNLDLCKQWLSQYKELDQAYHYDFRKIRK